MRGLDAAQAVEAIRRGAEGCERSLGVTTERELVRALVASMPTCWAEPSLGSQAAQEQPPRLATKKSDFGFYCDEHAGARADDLDYAPALRALLERMKAWDAPMPGAGEALLGDEGGRG